jgi:hypothetical protein
MYNFSKYEQLSHTNRSFDMNQQVDTQTYNSLVTLIDEFLDVSPFAKKFILRDKKTIEIIFETAFCYPMRRWSDIRNGNLPHKRVNAQMMAPLLISVYCTESFDNDWIKVGRLYSKLALFAIEQGYHVGFCNGVNYPMLKQFFSPSHFPFECEQHTFLCIGHKLKPESPHNWSFVTNALLPSFTKPTDEFIQILD